jgi:hypothetical protein
VPVTATTGVSNGGVPVTVADVFAGVRQQLPAVADFSAYLSSHQSGVSQLAIAYCSALMQNTGLRQGFFTNSSPADFRNNWQANLIDPMVNRFMGSAALLASHNTAVVRTELLNLLTYPGDVSRRAGLCAAGCNDAQVLSAATATCAAALANATLTLQ